ncbi:MAG: PKD domain-containing protein [Chitinispirillaceae bacterium]|nr:PKD domain-containing protein [Chitinispirillaceae bacterium]
MVRHSFFFLIALLVMMLGCGDDTISIGDPPPAPEFDVDHSDPNNVIFKVTKAEGFLINWDFGNGMLSQKSIDTIYYPFADTYKVSLTASNKGGATTTSEDVVIASTDPKICENRYYAMLTGGCDATSKTWKIPDADSAMANGPPSAKDSLGNGTSSYNDPVSYWWKSTQAGDQPVPPRALDDEYVFGLKGFTYKNDCHGDFYFNWKWCNSLFGTSQGTYKDTVHAYTPNDPATWKLDVDTLTPEEADTVTGITKNRFFTDTATGKRFNLILTLSNDNYLGYCSGVSIYQILSISPDTMFLRHELAEPEDANATGTKRLEWRYLRLVAKK